MITTSMTENRPYPESVYRGVSDEPIELADGTFAPPLTREIVETIAATKPAWASFDKTDIDDPNTVTWCNDYGKSLVSIAQNISYDVNTGQKLSEGPVRMQVWGGDPAEYTDLAESRQLAVDLLRTTAMLAQITDPRPLEFVRELDDDLHGGTFPAPWRSVFGPMPPQVKQGRPVVTVYDESERESAYGPLVYFGAPEEDMTIEDAEQYLVYATDMLATAYRVKAHVAAE